MTDPIDDRLRSLARELGGPDPGVTDAARKRMRHTLASRAEAPAPPPGRRRRFSRRGLLAIGGIALVGGASAVALTALDRTGPSAPLQCTVFGDRGAGPQTMNFYAPATGVTDAGDAVVAWVARGGSVQAATRAARGSWTAPRGISPPLLATFPPRTLALATGPDGTTLVGWTSQQTQVAEWRPGAGWSPAATLRVADFRTSPYEAPRLAISPSGRGVALWSAGRIVRYGARGGASIADQFPVVSVRGTDGSWRTLRGFPPGTSSGFSGVTAPAIAVDGDESIILAGGGNGPAMLFQRLSQDGRLVRSGIADGPMAYEVAGLLADGRGGLFSAWVRGTNVVAGLLPAGATRWRTRVVGNAGSFSPAIEIAMNSNGDAVVAYRGKPRGVDGPRFPSRAPLARRDRAVFVVTLDAATGIWSRPRVVSVKGAPAMSPHVGIDASGRALVAWVQGPNNGNGVTRVMVADGIGGVWSAPRALSAATRDPLAPALGVSPSGRAVVAWTGCRGRGAAVYAAELGAAGWSPARVVG